LLLDIDDFHFLVNARGHIQHNSLRHRRKHNKDSCI
jgi:hypothetical protein